MGWSVCARPDDIDGDPINASQLASKNGTQVDFNPTEMKYGSIADMQIDACRAAHTASPNRAAMLASLAMHARMIYR